MKRLYRILVFLCIAVILFSLLMILKECRDRKEDKETFDKVLSLALTPLADDEENDGLVSSLEQLPEDEKQSLPEINMALLRETNSDCTMWIYVEGTNINYPVMHTPDEPEEYIHKNFYGQKSSSGTPFLDGRCTVESENLIIYGHNMLNGTMFADLKKYLDKSFYNEHKTAQLYIDGSWRKYEIFAVVKTKSDDSWYSYILEADESVIEALSKKSLYKTDADYEKGDIFITLSTCYGKEDDDRLIIVAVA